MIKLIIFGFFLFFIQYICMEPPRPQISNVFQIKAKFIFTENTTSEKGEYFWFVDQPKGRSFERFNFEEDYQKSYIKIERYDLGYCFIINPNITGCSKTKLEGKMKNPFEWVQRAVYKGIITVNKRVLNYWEANIENQTLSIGVERRDANIPYFMSQKKEKTIVNMTIYQFYPTPAIDKFFDVPIQCRNHTKNSYLNKKVGCINRNTIITRAQSWVNQHIPYDQKKTFEGYRQDCSGYVSMAWNGQKPGWTTYTIPKVAYSISKEALLPGDILLCESEHVVLFGGWVNRDKSYMAYEETRPGEGTVKRETPYPYWSNTQFYKTYRYINFF
jgi:hypothetical protein